MDALVAVRRGVPGATLPELRPGGSASARPRWWCRTPTVRAAATSSAGFPSPTPAVLGRPHRQGRPAAGVPPGTSTSAPRSSGSGGCAAPEAATGPTYEELVETEGRPRLRMWLRAGPDGGVARGRRRARVLPVRVGGERPRRPARGRLGADPVHLPAAAPRPPAVPGGLLPLPGGGRAARAGPTSIAFQLVTMGQRIVRGDGGALRKNAYRDYLELHGLSVQLTEALAGVLARAGAGETSASETRTTPSSAGILRQGYRGSRYSSATPPVRTSRTGQAGEAARPERIGVEPVRGAPAAPRAVHGRPGRHHPEAKYFNAT
jgi:5-methyltetrahydrofolate--homocysteine methyltransferase